ncbi:LEC14B protein [Grifola frondosa]|uniref:LEC14B protein n=1 Tax=Grifola frondosa TaxID=5627 RepID=A0A1C7M0C1_GRIFR|nr:LEC14B protein [Grifola frondosa]
MVRTFNDDVDMSSDGEDAYEGSDTNINDEEQAILDMQEVIELSPDSEQNSLRALLGGMIAFFSPNMGCDVAHSFFASAYIDLRNTQRNASNTISGGDHSAGRQPSSALSTITLQDVQRFFNVIPSGEDVVSQTVDDDEDEEEIDEYEYGVRHDWDRSIDWVRHQINSRNKDNNIARVLFNRTSKARPSYKEDLASDIIPNSSGTAVAAYNANAYVGQFSSDSAFYYTCVRDFRLHVYDTSAPLRPFGPPCAPGYSTDNGHQSSMKVIKTITAHPGRWTITDSHLSPDNQRMIYASVSSTVYMTSTLDSSPVQTPIYFADNVRGRRGGWSDYEDDRFGIWSCKFSADGNEVIAGGSGMIFVYDLLADRRTVKILGHNDDVNSCCWADTASGNVLVSASDDSFIKVWDRRSLGASQRPSGVLVGHTEGITNVSAKGDGRYIISNGKDQVLRLWDLRMMCTNDQFEAIERSGRSYGIPRFDYRQGVYPKPRFKKHPQDCSVMQYTGHDVLRTLIRCHFSPAETTGQQYIYSGSSNGKIHIWSLDGKVVQVLDRAYTLPISYDPSGPQPVDGRPPSRNKICQPILMSAGWLGSHWSAREGSVIARHEWKGLSKSRGALEDYVEKQKSERTERAQRRARRWQMPGSFGAESDEDD